MAWSVGQATWVGDLSDAEISQQVGSRTFERGLAYAGQDRVRSLAAKPEGQMLLGTIVGSAGETYSTIVESRPHPRGRSPLWSGRCSCPVGQDCKHVVALLLTARDVAHGRRSGPAETPGGRGAAVGAPAAGLPSASPVQAHWSEVLGHVRPRVMDPETQQLPAPRGDLMPAGLLVDTIYRSRGWSREPDLSFGLRATRWTRRGAWHRSLTWHDALPQWRGGLRYLPEHEQLMTRIRDTLRKGSGSTTYFTDAVPLSLDASPEIWGLLVEAERAGIALLPGEGVGGPVELAAEAARLALEVTKADDASGDLVLQVTTEGMPDGLEGDLVHLGDPVHGLAVVGVDGTLTFVPLVQDLELSRAALLQALVGLRVPADERATFLRTAMPGLRERVRVRSQVPLPLPSGAVAGIGETPGPERVTVHVRVVGDVPGEIHLDQGFAYDGRVRAFATERFGGAVRDRTAEATALEAATSLREVPGAVWEDNGGFLHLSSRVELLGVAAARFVTDQLPQLEEDEHVTLVVDGDLPVYEEVTSAPIITLGVGDPGGAGGGREGKLDGRDTGPDDGPTDWFDLRISVEVGGEEVPLGPLLTALATDQPVMLLESGSWFRLDRPELHRLKALVEEARDLADPETGGLRLSRHSADFWDELVALGVVDRQSAQWVESVNALRGAGSEPADVPATLQATLRPYQLDGYHWLARLWDARLGGILADDMGLGKTLQVIAMATRAHDAGQLGGDAGPLLVVAPTSVVGTWLGEIEKFAPHVPAVAVTRTAAKRDRPLADEIAGASIVVTTYAVLRLDEASFHPQRWAGVVVDEAQFVKNRQAKTHVAVRKLESPFTLAVTGTPLENSLMDLWSMLSLTAPGLYPRPDVFTKNYRKPIESGERPELLDLLRRRIRPLMLRRTKEQVAVDLPPKQIQVLPLEPHPVHRHVYDQHLQRERQRILGLLADPDANRVAILAALTRLRQLALDPALVDEEHSGKAQSAKIAFLVEQLRELAAEGHRALVFSQFTRYLRMAEQALTEAGLRSCYLDGATTNRQQVIRSFRDGQAAAFLISLKAGGFGLTLTEADYVFVLDPWWNPAAEAQAIDRAHRIGQTRPVTVYRLVSTGTIEEKVVALQERKRDLFQRVVDDGGALSGAITSDDIKNLLDLG